MPENGEQCRESLRESLALADRHDFPVHTVDSWFLIVFGQGDLQQLRDLQDYTRDRQGPQEESSYHFREGHVAFLKGQFAVAEREYQLVCQLLQEHGVDQRFAMRVRPFLGFAILAQGRPEQADLQFSAEVVYWEGRNPVRHARCLRGRARVDLHNGNLAGALERLREARNLAGRGFGHEGWPEWQSIQLDLAHVLILLGEVDEAQELARTAYISLKRLRHFLWADAAFTLAEISAAQNHRGEARRYAREARTTWERLDLIQQNRPRLENLLRLCGSVDSPT